VRVRMDRCTHSFVIRRFAIRTLWLATFFGLGLWPLLAGGAAEQLGAVDLSGAPVDPLQAAPGKVVVLIFVRTDCPISNRYAPTIQGLSAKHAGKALFWLVYPDKTESPEAIRKHQRDFGYRLPAVRDMHYTLVKESRAQITPEAAVFDATHRLVYHGRIDNLYEDFGRARTAATTHELDDAILAAIQGKTPAVDNVSAVGCYIADLK
jgi:hypothetical protein